MACGDVLSLGDLQTAKKHQLFEIECITGKVGGTGANIDYATNQVTGQIQKTMPAIMRDIGFEPASFDFTSGGTLGVDDRNKAVLWPLPSGGDGDWYYWEGALPKVVPAASTPTSTGGVVEGAWRPVGDITLRGDLLAGALMMRGGKFALRDLVSVVDCGAQGGNTDDTAAFQSAVSAGGGTAFVPYNPAGYTVNAHVYGLVGFGAVQFKGAGLVSYTDLSKSDGEYLTCANIAKLLSDGQNTTIACVGDSTMYGYLVGGATPQTQDPNNPPLSLKRTLGHVYGYTGTVINAAVSGNNMNDLMTTAPSFESRISTGDLSTASVIYCNMAINDCQNNLSIDEFKQNYFDFVSIVRRYGKVPVVVTPNPINPLLGGDKRESTQIDMYAQAMRDVAVQTGCDMVDNYYWTKKTALRYTETVIVPDGIHPSTDLYKQLGRNLAIPLVSANTLRKAGDIASLAGSSYLDTAASAILRQDQTRTGLSFSATRGVTAKGINCPVILNEPFDYVSFMALQWENGARAQVGVQDNTSPWGFPRCGKNTGAISNYKWDTEFTVKTDAMAGLNVLYWVFDQSDTRPTNNALALSGFSIPVTSPFSGALPQTPTGLTVADAFVRRIYVSSRKYLSTVYDFTVGGVGVEAKDVNGAYVFKLYINGTNELRLDLYNNVSGVLSSSLLASGEPAGRKSASVYIFDDMIKVLVTRVSTGVTIEQSISLTNNLTPFTLSNAGVQFSVGTF